MNIEPLLHNLMKLRIVTDSRCYTRNCPHSTFMLLGEQNNLV